MTAPPRIFTPEYYERMRALEQGGWWNAGMRDAAELLLRRARLPDRGRLLDIGCGSGQSMRWFLAGRPHWSAVGIDVSEHGLEAAAASGLDVQRASALELPFPDRTVDFVICLDVLQHLPLDGGDRRAFREMKRVLRPGGCALIRTNAQAFPRAVDDPDNMFRKYEPRQLRERIVEAGLGVVRLGRINALLGLAEIPREMRSRKAEGDGYHGIMAEPRSGGRLDALKRAWLRQEGRLLDAGAHLPFGRTILALCRA